VSRSWLPIRLARPVQVFARAILRDQRVALFVLLGAAIGLRVAGLSWGLPYEYHPDEPTHVNIVVSFLKTGDLNPHWFLYPSLSLYIGIPVAIVYFLLRVQRGDLVSVQDLIVSRGPVAGTGITAVPGLYLGLRILVVAFGAASVVYLYRRQTLLGRRSAFLAALFLTLSPLHVLVSHWYRADTMVALFAGATVISAVGLYRTDALAMYLLCGALAGLSGSVKYNLVAVLFVPLVLAHLMARRSLLDWRLWLMGIIAVVAFLVTTPYAVLDLPNFLDGFAYEVHHYYVRGHPGADWTGSRVGLLLWYAWRMVRFDGPVALLAFVGPLLARRGRRAEAFILWSWLATVLVMNGSSRVYTALALVPVLLVEYTLAALALDGVLSRAERWPHLGRRWVPAALVTAALVVPVYQTARVNARFLQPDVRTLAREWIEANTPPDARVVVEGYGPTLAQERALHVWHLYDNTPQWYQAAGYEYVVASNYDGHFSTPELYPNEVAAYRELFQFPLLATLSGPMQYHVDPIREIRVYQVPIPTRYELAMFAADAPWLCAGFYQPEDVAGMRGRWTGAEAVLRLRLKQDTDYVLRFRGLCLRPEESGAVQSTVIVDGLALGRYKWSKTTEEWSVLLAAGAHSGGMVEIVLRTDTWVPADETASDDTRALGVFLESIVVEEAGA